MPKNSRLDLYPHWKEKIRTIPHSATIGSVLEVTGPKIRAALISAAVGDLVTIESRIGEVRGQVVGVAPGNVIISCLDPLTGVSAGAPVRVTSGGARIILGDHLLGAVVNGFGEVIAGEGPETTDQNHSTQFLHNSPSAECVPIYNEAPTPLARRGIDSQLFTGVRAIDAFTPIGFGQRLCILAEPGVGKSTLFGMIAKHSTADVNVIALIGERGREVNEFLYETLDAESRSRSVAVISTGDEPALRRVFAAQTATRVAEYYRAKGLRVLLLMDSLTRLCRAYREVGLAAGEPPVRRGYPPSVFAELPRLIERSGCAERGSITALYTMLLSSDLEEDPMVDEVKGITDGHIVLRSALAERGHYPAIDVVSSISRLTSKLLAPQLLDDMRLLRALLARLKQDRELVMLSETVDPELTRAIELEPELIEFLKQESSDRRAEQGDMAQSIATSIQRLGARARATFN